MNGYIGIVDSIKAQSSDSTKRLEEAERLIREVCAESTPYTKRLCETLWGEAAREWLAGSPADASAEPK